MKLTFLHRTHSDAVRALVVEETRKLDRVSDSIRECEVLVDCPHLHHHKGRRARLRVSLHGAGYDLVVERGSGRGRDGGDVYEEIRDAFRVIRSRLRERVEKIRDRARSLGGKQRLEPVVVTDGPGEVLDPRSHRAVRPI